MMFYVFYVHAYSHIEDDDVVCVVGVACPDVLPVISGAAWRGRGRGREREREREPESLI